jgi:hypothetical protein
VDEVHFHAGNTVAEELKKLNPKKLFLLVRQADKADLKL